MGFELNELRGHREFYFTIELAMWLGLRPYTTDDPGRPFHSSQTNPKLESYQGFNTV